MGILGFKVDYRPVPMVLMSWEGHCRCAGCVETRQRLERLVAARKAEREAS